MTQGRIGRRIAAALGVMLALFLLGALLPSTAGALPNVPDCNDAPTPEVPGRGVEAFFEPAPAVPPPAADPFAAGSKTSIHEQYGYAGLRWNTYGLGCSGAVGSPEASVGTTVANWIFTIPKAVVAATGAMLGAAYEPSFLSVFDPLITTVTDALRRSVFEQWMGLTVAGLGFLIVWRARKQALSGTTAAIAWALFVMVVATVLFRWPLAAGQAADSTVVSTMSSVTAALDEHDATGHSSTGQLAAANLHDALLYQVWLGGEFGDANSVAARKYGAQLFDSQSLTWSEASTLAQDPGSGQRIIEAKKAKFQQIAAQVQSEDPDAYEYLTGRRTDARVGFASLSLFAVACAVPFLLMASLLVIGALVITRFAVMLFPAIATLGLFPAMRSLVIGVGNTVAAAVINAMVFGIGTAVLVKAFGAVMSPGNGLPSWLVVALVLLLTLVMWYAMRPFHRLTAMATPGRQFSDAAGALGSVTRGIGRMGGRLVGTAAGVFLAESTVNHRKQDEDKEQKEKEADRARRRAEENSETGTDDTAGPATGPVAGPAGILRRPLNGLLGHRGPQPVEATGSASGSGSGSSSSSGSGSGSGRPARGGAAPLRAAEVGLVPAEQRTPARTAPARPAGSTRSGPRRSEGADLDDPGTPAVRATMIRSEPHPGRAPADDLDGDEVFAVYRPGDPAGGDGRG